MAKRIFAKHLETVGDLVVAAPIKQGFIDAYEPLTYETRLRRTAHGLFRARKSVREFLLTRPFADVAERIRSFESFRVAILDGEPATPGDSFAHTPESKIRPKQLVITATFDQPWEPYMRLIWDPLGPFLDLLLCNCEGYPLAAQTSWFDYRDWVAEHSIDTAFFYSSSPVTSDDILYLNQVERLYRDNATGAADAAAIQSVAIGPDQATALVRIGEPIHTMDTALEGLVALYKLSRMFQPGTPDAPVLVRATRSLLNGWIQPPPTTPLYKIYKEQIDWFNTPVPPQPAPVERLTYDPAKVQGGILRSYGTPQEPMTHGALLLLRIADPAKARAFLSAQLQTQSVTTEATNLPSKSIRLNIAFTYRGLVNIGMPQADLDLLPAEFVQGMEERGTKIGDVRSAHPRRWTLPERNWPTSRAAAGAGDHPVDLSEIDIVIQLRTHCPDDPAKPLPAKSCDAVADPHNPLHDAIVNLDLDDSKNGLVLLAVESTRRTEPDGHFGLRDGISQPNFVERTPFPASPDDVARGEVLWGHCNDHGRGGQGDPPHAKSDYLDNGSFGAIRKLKQNVEAYNQLLDVAAAGPSGMSREQIVQKMIGRDPAGTPAIPATGLNNFNYSSDPAGLACPFQAHIRRANPRSTPPHAGGFGRPTPRIARRGMSYGPDYAEDPKAERGIIFQAWNASLAEQFEVVQRWINGGNPTGVSSSQSDPLIGTADGNKRTFRFLHNGVPVSIQIPNPPVTLQWGLYVFAPGIDGLAKLAAGPAVEDDPEIKRGQRIIDRLAALPDNDAAASWKIILEDFEAKDADEDADFQAVIAAIKAKHGGALRIRCGTNGTDTAVLVAGKDLSKQFYGSDRAGNAPFLSMVEQQARMATSFGKIFLGEDWGQKYEDDSKATNDVLMKVTEQCAFERAYKTASANLTAAINSSPTTPSVKFDLHAKYLTPVLALLCLKYFEIPDDKSTPPKVEAGGWDWSPVPPRAPRCPGDFMSPSRHAFYPEPNSATKTFGKMHGKALQAAVLAKFPGTGTPPSATIPAAMYIAKTSDSQFASDLVGIMVGMLPPTEGCLTGTLYDWLENNTLWRHQQAYRTGAPATPTPTEAYSRAKAALDVPLRYSMRKRPAPDLLYRTATTAGPIGNVQVNVGEKVIVATGPSCEGEDYEQRIDVGAIFGGLRTYPAGYPTHTHACPAYKMAMGMMLGIIAALLDAGRIEKLPANLIIKLTGFSALPVAPPASPASGLAPLAGAAPSQQDAATSPSPQTPGQLGPAGLTP